MFYDDEETLEREYDFETKFYNKLTNNKDFILIGMPDIDGEYPTKEEVFILKKTAKDEGKVVLYQVKMSNNSYVVFSENEGVYGYIPSNYLEEKDRF